MLKINLTKEYKIKCLIRENSNIVETLCKECLDYYILTGGTVPSKEEVKEIFIALPPNKNYEDKFVLGIYKLNELIGLVDIIKDFITTKEWTIGLMLIKPQERSNGLGKVVHKALVEWAKDLGAKSFRIGVIEDNYKGINFWSSLGYKKIKEVNMDFNKKTHLVNVMRLNLYNNGLS